jgi:transcription antitermination factor NusG
MPGKASAFIRSVFFARLAAPRFSHERDRIDRAREEATMTTSETGRPGSEQDGVSASTTDPDARLRWFAVYTASRHEKKVAQHLTEREIEFYLPLYQSKRKWRDGSRVTLDLPLFPGYLFVHIRRGERVRVLEVPGALAVVGGNGREPVPLPDEAIDALRSGLHLRHAEPHALLAVGQRARIRYGALAGMEGFVVRRKSGLRVVLTLEYIQRSVSVEVAADDLEPLAGSDLSAAALDEE